MQAPRPPKQYPKPPEGTWTEHYPELGTAPVSYESSISPEFYQLEREAVFKRAWLNVGRVEQLRRKGGFFTKDLAVANTSLIVVNLYLLLLAGITRNRAISGRARQWRIARPELNGSVVIARSLPRSLRLLAPSRSAAQA